MTVTDYEKVDVAIIGAGPAGLAAAVELREQGVDRVLVIEREAVAGGIPRHCAHPPFGLREYGRILTGPAYAQRNVLAAQRAGVVIRVGHTVTRLGPQGGIELVSPDGISRIQARRVLVATGVRETPRSARLIGGDRPVGVINTGALQAYLYLQRLKPFERPLIVGSELVSLSSLLSCRRAGIAPVAMIERNSRVTARWPLSLFPRLCGVPLHLGAELLAVHGSGRVESASVRMADGSLRHFECDGVLLTGCFVPESSLMRMSGLDIDPMSGGPVIDQYGRCSDPAYFAAGNLLRPVETAGWSYREGRKVASLIARDLLGELPQAGPAIRVACRGPLKLCVPQRLTPSALAGLEHLQLRVNTACSGLLVVRADGREIWSDVRACLPERRLLIALSRLRIPQGTRSLEVDFVGY
ncbi:NAD(P)/FAD-dependent oxidoreductase [Phytopseudomonas dryadis]|uniref:Pyridine nucleotide-disulfide oxidoreductase n=1 Tax=Phytopseudomonas dryadis TaxID=2487520 RepID=A0ABY1Z9N8_9GAMM|nr:MULTISPECIES: FAD-dependent oxidoreductase [Pseudomonas]TBV06984.1 pyridine nucleotide-disulfide oxidoreductase [Pseudomonas dryadis]TBV19624.1 pyridine nucleotide-disulfide oxidoreductase [Pseudomonas sp. FRB 230]